MLQWESTQHGRPHCTVCCLYVGIYVRTYTLSAHTHTRTHTHTHTHFVYRVVDWRPRPHCFRASFTGCLPSPAFLLLEDTPTRSKVESITGMMSSLPYTEYKEVEVGQSEGLIRSTARPLQLGHPGRGKNTPLAASSSTVNETTVRTKGSLCATRSRGIGTKRSSTVYTAT